MIIRKLILVWLSMLSTFPFVDVLSQKGYVISVSTSRMTHSSNTSIGEPDIQHMVDEIVKYAKIIQKSNCAQRLQPEIDKQLRAEMKKISEGTPYLLTVDYEDCKFVSLVPDRGSGAIGDKNATLYRITLYQEIEREPVVKPDPDGIKKFPILATYINEKGKWIAISPYEMSEGYETEERAIGALFYTAGELSFLKNSGKFRVYKFNKPQENIRIDVRGIIKQLGATDIPE